MPPPSFWQIPRPPRCFSTPWGRLPRQSCAFSLRRATRTSNLKKYLLRLFIAAVISHVPYALCFKFTVWEFWYVTGVLWGLFWGFSPSRCGNGCARPFACGCFCSGCAACSPTPANWNYIAVLWIFGFAVFRESPKKQWAFFGLVTLLYVLQYFVYGSTLPVWLRPFVLLCVPLLYATTTRLVAEAKFCSGATTCFTPLTCLCSLC